MSLRPLNVLTLQPFYTGSHRQFIDDWIKRSRHHWTLLSLPGRHWKWRMRQAAIAFADQLDRIHAGVEFDCVVATDMLNLAEMRGLLAATGNPTARLPMALYVHENQFAYPTRFEVGSPEAKRDQHFSFTNFVSTIAADQVWFNSAFNRDSMIAGLEQHSRHWPDMVPHTGIDRLPEKSHVLHPGIDVGHIDQAALRAFRIQRAIDGQPIELVWAARWEHDKGPAALLATLRQIDEMGVEFRLNILGESFRKVPDPLSQIHEQFRNRLVQFGYLDSRADYLAAMGRSDLFLSTAEHEFFGLAAAEAIALGIRVLLPNRLAYPELASLAGGMTPNDLTPADLLYDGPVAEPNLVRPALSSPSDLATRIRQVADHRLRMPRAWLPSAGQTDLFTNRMCWTVRSEAFDLQLANLAAGVQWVPQAKNSDKSRNPMAE